MTQKLRIASVMTDIHFGAKGNSEQHNQDCINYIDWFCNKTLEHHADHIIFLGDWFENRSAINVSTLTYSYKGAKKLNDLGIPVYFVIGNHDLYHRHTRELYSTIQFHEFSNFTIISEPTVIPQITTTPLLCPFLFPDEYPDLVQYNHLTTWWGHFEFKGFVVTGYNIIMPTGPDHTLFDGPKYIFSGHYHKRQWGDNVIYIGNTFPTSFSDANDTARGMMVYDHIKQDMFFYDWEECPKYIKTSLSALLDGNIIIPPNSRVKCLIDVPISFEENTALKHSIIDEYHLREFIMEETLELSDALTGTEVILEEDGVVESVDDLVIQMLKSIEVVDIDNNMLIEQYKRLE